MELDKQAKENKALKDKISNSEGSIAHYQRISEGLNQLLAQTQIKLAEAHNNEAGILSSKVQELEGTVSGKNSIISLLKDQDVRIRMSYADDSYLKTLEIPIIMGRNFERNLDKIIYPCFIRYYAYLPSTYKDKSG